MGWWGSRKGARQGEAKYFQQNQNFPSRSDFVYEHMSDIEVRLDIFHSAICRFVLPWTRHPQLSAISQQVEHKRLRGRLGSVLWKVTVTIMASHASPSIRADFWAGDPTKHFSVKKRGFQ